MNSLFGGSLRMLYSARVYSARLNVYRPLRLLRAPDWCFLSDRSRRNRHRLWCRCGRLQHWWWEGLRHRDLSVRKVNHRDLTNQNGECNQHKFGFQEKNEKKTCGDLTSKTGLSAAVSFNNKKWCFTSKLWQYLWRFKQEHGNYTSTHGDLITTRMTTMIWNLNHSNFIGIQRFRNQPSSYLTPLAGSFKPYASKEVTSFGHTRRVQHEAITTFTCSSFRKRS